MEEKKKRITKTGKDQLINQLESLKKERVETLGRLEIAREFGDLKENAEYQEAKTSLRQIDQKIDEIKIFLGSCIIIETHNKEVVEFGSKVEIKNLLNGTISFYTIVSDLESDISEGLLSDSSPIAFAMIGKKVNEEFSLITDRGEKKFVILSIK